MSCELDCWKEYQIACRVKLAKSMDGNESTAEVTTPMLSATSGSAEFFDPTGGKSAPRRVMPFHPQKSY